MLGNKRSSVLFTFTTFLLLLMSLAGFYSIYVTTSISSDAMVINKLGTIRGITQRTVKLELSNVENNELISKVDATFDEFTSDKIKLFDSNHEVMDAIRAVEDSWIRVKNSIYQYRKDSSSANRLALLSESEELWHKANDMVFASQASSEQKLSKYKLSFVVFFFNIALSSMIIFLIKRFVKDALEGMVNYDSLTGISNRRYFSEFLQKEIIRSERYGKAFSLIMLDIDFFKKINDNYGHDVGDKILQGMAAVISRNIRKSDLFARVGGEEFAIVAPETSLEEAAALAEKIRQVVEQDTFANGLRITISLGVSVYQDKDNDNMIFKKADNALYKAKGNGRNRVEVILNTDNHQNA